jgi:hypothetical protein
MRLPNKTFYASLLFFNFLTLGMQAQPIEKDSLATHSAYTTALRQYHAWLAPETGLYRGVQYIKYTDKLKEGHPYFEENRMQKGTVWYNGVLYEDLSLIYDLVKDLLVISDPYNTNLVALISGQVDRFTLGSHLFIRLSDSLNPSAPHNGFYEQLYSGRTTLLKKEVKTIGKEESMEDGIQKRIVSATSWYLKKGEVYYAVGTKKSLLNALKDRRKEGRKYIRDNGLDIQKDTDDALPKVLAWYDSFNH